MSPKGKTVLDIGCWDGYFSVEALRRGTSRVLATDHYVWHTQWSRGAFDLVREHLAPELEVADIDVYDLSPAAIGTFDIVLFTGLLYHMRRPLLAARAGGKRLRRSPDPRDGARRHGPRAPGDGVLPGTELKDDPSNWWGPNRLCVEAMLCDVGFGHITYTPTPIPKEWTIFDRFKRNPAITPRGGYHARRGARPGPREGDLLQCDGLGSRD